MKKILKIAFSIVLCINLTACDETVDTVVYQGVQGSDSTLIAFSQNTYDLPVDRDATGSVELILNVSTVASFDRTFDVVVNNDAEVTTADPNSYILPSTVTVAAGSYQGYMTIIGEDTANDLIQPVAKSLVFSLEGLTADMSNDTEEIVIRLFEICPVPDDFFLGSYFLEDVTATTGPGNGTENFETSIVEVYANTKFSRTFRAGLLPAFTGAPFEVTLSFTCLNTIEISNITVLSGGCGDSIPYAFGPSPNASTQYDPNNLNDLEFTINYQEDGQGSCGGPFASSFKLTKL